MKNNKAITLIALVITIVVLIILAGVIISIILDNGGIIDRTKKAKQEYSNTQGYEETKIAETANQIDQEVNGSRDTVTLTQEEYLNLQKRGTWKLLTSSNDISNTDKEKDVEDLSKFTSLAFVIRADESLMSSDIFTYDLFKQIGICAPCYYNSNSRRAYITYVNDTKVKIRCQTNASNIKMTFELYGIY